MTNDEQRVDVDAFFVVLVPNEYEDGGDAESCVCGNARCR